MKYEEFLKSKERVDKPNGISPTMDINEKLFPFQRDIVRWSLRRGRAAIFADCGLGKTAMQLEWAKHIAAHCGGKVLILCPLAVAEQTVKEGNKFDVAVYHSRDGKLSDGVNVLNYERLHLLEDDPCGIVLDESSILKSFMGKTKQELVRRFASVPYKLACTATPAPNDWLEIGNHSQFLDVMDSNEMISRWFTNDTMSAGSYKLKGHAKKDFYKWMASWCVSLSKPSDIGYSDDGFILPKLSVNRHIVPVDWNQRTEGMLFRMPSLSATDIHAEFKITARSRAQACASLVKSGEPNIIWCNTNYEADELVKFIPKAVDLRGGEKDERKEEILNKFSNGEIETLITKPSIGGFGLNWQHCANAIFIGLSYSFEQYYQALRRTWRFGQKRPVNVHIVQAETETNILDIINAKEAAHMEMKRELETGMSVFEREEIKGDLKLTTGFKAQEVVTERYKAVCGDSCELIKDLPDDSIDMSIFSPPFSNLYIYSDSIRDMGNSADLKEFMAHFKFLIAELLRATKNGRICAIHVKDLPAYMGRDGAAGLIDFPGECIRAFTECGWQYHSRCTVWKDPVIEMQRTKNHGLLYKQLRKDSCASRMGMADFILAFRCWKKGNQFDDPVEHTKEEFNLDQWQQWASPVWMDINQTNVLNIRAARDPEDEKHICPLQLDLIKRCLILWSNKGDTIFSPFMGIGSEGYVVVQNQRKFIGFELKESYWRQAVKNLETADMENMQDDLFARKAANA